MADNSTILEKLDGLVARFEEISTLITDPAVIADQKRYVKLTKEYQELDDLMKARKEYIQLLGNIEEAKNILANESDTEMREMAKEEMDNAKSLLAERMELTKEAKAIIDNFSSTFTFSNELLDKSNNIIFTVLDKLSDLCKSFIIGTLTVLFILLFSISSGIPADSLPNNIKSLSLYLTSVYFCLLLVVA